MNKKRRIHDGIVGAVITFGVLLGYYGNPLWLLVPGLLAIALLQSRFAVFLSLVLFTRQARYSGIARFLLV